MADRPPVSGEPSTLRFLYDAAATIYDWDDSGNGVPSDDAWKRLEEALQEAHEALEAEARATPPLLDAERLAMAAWTVLRTVTIEQAVAIAAGAGGKHQEGGRAKQ